MNRKKNQLEQDEKTLAQEMRESIIGFYKNLENWMLPKNNHPLILKVLLFVVKLPVLILVLIASPVAMLFLVLAFVVAL